MSRFCVLAKTTRICVWHVPGQDVRAGNASDTCVWIKSGCCCCCLLLLLLLLAAACCCLLLLLLLLAAATCSCCLQLLLLAAAGKYMNLCCWNFKELIPIVTSCYETASLSNIHPLLRIFLEGTTMPMNAPVPYQASMCVCVCNLAFLPVRLCSQMAL